MFLLVTGDAENETDAVVIERKKGDGCLIPIALFYTDSVH